jgi:hypothetical protein
MSFKNQHHSLISRQKIGLNNQKDRALIEQKIGLYVAELQKPKNKRVFPSITSASLLAGIAEKNLIAWELTTPENSTIRCLLDTIRDLQKEKLIDLGLNKIYDSKIVTLLLKAHHGLREEPTQLTQNNTFNVSPEILAEALEISRQKKPLLPKV